MIFSWDIWMVFNWDKFKDALKTARWMQATKWDLALLMRWCLWWTLGHWRRSTQKAIWMVSANDGSDRNDLFHRIWQEKGLQMTSRRELFSYMLQESMCKSILQWSAKKRFSVSPPRWRRWMTILFQSQLYHLKGTFSSRLHKLVMRQWTNLCVGFSRGLRAVISGSCRMITFINKLLISAT